MTLTKADVQRLIEQAIILETTINQAIQKGCTAQTAHALELASDNVAHQVTEWLRSAQNRCP